MATRMFTVDLGSWSVKLAIASPGLRGATLLNVVERIVPQGDEPLEYRAAQRGLSRADIAGHHGKPFAAANGIFEQFERVPVALAPVEKLRVRRQAEWFFGEAKILFVHS